MFFFCKQKTSYEMRISDWSSDVCSSDLQVGRAAAQGGFHPRSGGARGQAAGRRAKRGAELATNAPVLSLSVGKNGKNRMPGAFAPGENLWERQEPRPQFRAADPHAAPRRSGSASTCSGRTSGATRTLGSPHQLPPPLL